MRRRDVLKALVAWALGRGAIAGTISGPAADPSSIAVLGVGGAGVNVVGAVAERLAGVGRVLAFDTDPDRLRWWPGRADAAMLLGTGNERRLKTPGTARDCVIERAHEIVCAIEGCSQVLLVGSLAGTTASGAMPELSRLLRASGRTVHAMVILPVEFEITPGDVRQAGNEAIAALAAQGQVLWLLFNEDILTQLGPEALVEEVFRAGDEALVAVYDRMVAAPGVTALERLALPGLIRFPA